MNIYVSVYIVYMSAMEQNNFENTCEHIFI